MNFELTRRIRHPRLWLRVTIHKLVTSRALVMGTAHPTPWVLPSTKGPHGVVGDFFFPCHTKEKIVNPKPTNQSNRILISDSDPFFYSWRTWKAAMLIRHSKRFISSMLEGDEGVCVKISNKFQMQIDGHHHILYSIL
jgi:hypothetical protein